MELDLAGVRGDAGEVEHVGELPDIVGHVRPGGNCTKICLPGKLILSKRKGLRELLFS